MKREIGRRAANVLIIMGVIIGTYFVLKYAFIMSEVNP